METTTNYSPLPFTDQNGLPVLTRTPLLTDYPTESVVIDERGADSVVKHTICESDAEAMLSEMPGHPRNTVLEALQQGWVVKVRWKARSIVIAMYLPAVWNGQRGPLFEELEAAVEDPGRGYRRIIGYRVSWDWDWDNDRYAYEKDSPHSIRLNCHTQTLCEEDSAVGQERLILGADSLREHYDGISLKQFRANYVAGQGPSTRAVEASIAQHKANELAAEVAAYEADADSPARVAERATVEREITRLTDQANRAQERADRHYRDIQNSIYDAFDQSEYDGLAEQVQMKFALDAAVQHLKDALEMDGQVKGEGEDASLQTIGKHLDVLRKMVETAKRTALTSSTSVGHSQRWRASQQTDLRAAAFLDGILGNVERAIAATQPDQ